jgi:hypothetical protein
VFKAVAVAVTLTLAAAALAANGAEPPLRDPMQPFRAVGAEGGPGAAPTPRFRLTAVVISPTRRIAVINGKPYSQGQTVGGAEIVQIDAQSVGLRDGEEELVVHLGKTHTSAKAVTGDSGQ